MPATIAPIKSEKSPEIIEIEGVAYEHTESEQAHYYTPSDCSDETRLEIETRTAEIEMIITELKALFPESTLEQHVAFCEPQFYVDRFVGKSQREQFDPAPWAKWSEGDVDLLTTAEGVHKALFVKLGAEFLSTADRLRFYGHELTHPLLSEATDKEPLILDAEGLTETDQRVGLDLQSKPEMAVSTSFTANLKLARFVKPQDILEAGYDHESFEPVTVSKNPGYALCFLWMYEMTAEIAEHAGFEGDVRAKYLFGRQQILDAYREAHTIEEYKRILKIKTGFDYDERANDIGYFPKAQERFKKDFGVTAS